MDVVCIAALGGADASLKFLQNLRVLARVEGDDLSHVYCRYRGPAALSGQQVPFVL